MKISFIDDEPEIFPNQYGGKARTIVNLAKSFAKSDAVEKVTILSRTINDKRDSFCWNNIHFKKLVGYGMVRQIVDEADSTDILNVHTCSFTMPYLKDRKSVIVNHLHDVVYATSDAGSHLDKAIGGRWNAIIAPSEFAANVLKHLTPWSNLNEKVITIPRAIDADIFHEVPSEIAFAKIQEFNSSLKISPSSKYPILFFPHRINAGKGESFLPELCKSLLKRYPSMQIFATFDNDIDVKIPNLINLKWIPTDFMKYFYSISDLTISLSMLPESFSQICLESIACGTPVSCFKFGNLSDLSKRFPAIRICQPNIEDIYANIENILDNSSEMKKDIKASQMIIREEYSIENITKTYISLYQNLLQNKGGIGYIFLKDITKLEEIFFLSPGLADYGSSVYLYENQKLKRTELTKEEQTIIQLCKSPVTLLALQQKLGDSCKTKKQIQNLLDKKIIIRG